MITGDGEMNEYSCRTCPEIVLSNSRIYSPALLLCRSELPVSVLVSALQRGRCASWVPGGLRWTASPRVLSRYVLMYP